VLSELAPPVELATEPLAVSEAEPEADLEPAAVAVADDDESESDSDDSVLSLSSAVEVEVPVEVMVVIDPLEDMVMVIVEAAMTRAELAKIRRLRRLYSGGGWENLTGSHAWSRGSRARKRFQSGGVGSRIRNRELARLSQNALIARRGALKVDAVVAAGSRAGYPGELVRPFRGVHVGSDIDADGGIDVHVREDNVEVGRVRGDGGPSDLVVFAQVDGGAFSGGGDLERESRRHECEESRWRESELHFDCWLPIASWWSWIGEPIYSGVKRESKKKFQVYRVSKTNRSRLSERQELQASELTDLDGWREGGEGIRRMKGRDEKLQ
jgi:hypothetical protein